MPKYTVRNNLPQDAVFVKIYHGSGLTWSIGLIDKKKNEFVLDVAESYTFVDDTESVTMLATILGNEKVKGEIIMERNPKKCDVAAWPLQTSNLFISATASRDGDDGYDSLYFY